MTPSATPRAVALTVLLLPVVALGGFVGATVGTILGAQAGNGGWEALIYGLLGSVVGGAVLAGLLGFIWATICKRRRLLPTAVLFLLAGLGSIGALVLISRVPGSGQDSLRIAASVGIGVAALAVAYVIGLRTPPRAAAADARRREGQAL